MPEEDGASLLVWLVNQGVAVAVVGFVLWRLERRLGELHDAVDALTLALVRTGAINGNPKAAALLASVEQATGGGK